MDTMNTDDTIDCTNPDTIDCTNPVAPDPDPVTPVTPINPVNPIMLSLHVHSTGHALRQQVGSGGSRALRPFLSSATIAAAPDKLTPADVFYLIGTPTHHTLYSLQSLLDSPMLGSMAASAATSDDPILGKPASFPPSLHAALDDAQYTAMVSYLLGGTMPTSIAARVVMQGLSDTLYKAGYTIGKATSMTAVYQRHLQACIAASDDLSPIERLTGTEQAAMLLQNPTLHISSRLAQRAWPWKDMEVWDKVVIPANLAREGQRAVHSYAAGTNKLFSTRRTATGALTVVRMPGVRRARL